ncbi:N-acetylmuramic acid 6-phosphate etherase [Maribacter sp.]|uniref:N-acetylmuramic acid 6-phosphate etherase n=1 Tax=Maribacter sp. TaxID=1897614 RepID=UPI0025BF5D54|nr:N-acetylmuramic acid 6-phosphate etherase [Maribacter sp.]
MKNIKPTTEESSRYTNLENRSTEELLRSINTEDKLVPLTIEKVIPKIESFVDVVVDKMKKGGRLFYIGAGTSGRLGVLDASECPPTFGVSSDWIIGLIAGGDIALRKAVENAEDDIFQAQKDLEKYKISENDVLLGIAASGTTPYVVGGLKFALDENITSGCIVCNTNSPMAELAKYPIEVIVGPEFVTGSTRMKAGTAQKLVLNMISTAVMIKLGRVMGNKMVDMQLSNKKLTNRAMKMVVEALHISEDLASELLAKNNSVRAVIENYKA